MQEVKALLHQRCIHRSCKMKKLLIGAILSVAFACGIFVYTSWEKRRIVNALPQPPAVKQVVDIHPHPHPHEDPVLAPPSNTVRVDSEPGAKENTVSTSTEQMSEKGPRKLMMRGNPRMWNKVARRGKPMTNTNINPPEARLQRK
jgi:hypothetical protein